MEGVVRLTEGAVPDVFSSLRKEGWKKTIIKWAYELVKRDPLFAYLLYIAPHVASDEDYFYATLPLRAFSYAVFKRLKGRKPNAKELDSVVEETLPEMVRMLSTDIGTNDPLPALTEEGPKTTLFIPVVEEPIVEEEVVKTLEKYLGGGSISLDELEAALVKMEKVLESKVSNGSPSEDVAVIRLDSFPVDNTSDLSTLYTTMMKAEEKMEFYEKKLAWLKSFKVPRLLFTKKRRLIKKAYELLKDYYTINYAYLREKVALARERITALEREERKKMDHLLNLSILSPDGEGNSFVDVILTSLKEYEEANQQHGI